MSNLWEPYNPQYADHPYEMYRRLRDTHPVYATSSGDVVVSSHAGVREVLQQPATYRVGNRHEWIKRQVEYLKNKEHDLTAITDAMNSFLVMMNPPAHAPLRSLIMDAWSDHDVDEIIRHNISQLLQNLDPGGFDLVTDFAAPLPALTIASIMGLPKQDYLQLKEYAHGVLKSMDLYTSFSELVRIDQASHDFIAYLNNYLDYRETHLASDLVSKIILLNKDRNVIVTRAQLISVCIFLFMAGEETTVNLIGTGSYHLMKQPDLINEAIRVPDMLDQLVEEALRYDAPVQLLGRIANEDSQLLGNLIPKETTITLVVGAANRDPSVFQEPDDFRIRSNSKGHLSFGAGTHFCLGSWLARKQWKLAIYELFRHFPHLQPSATPTWSNMLHVRGIRMLPVAAA